MCCGQEPRHFSGHASFLKARGGPWLILSCVAEALRAEVTKAMAHSRTTAESGAQQAREEPVSRELQPSEEEELPGAARF